MDYSFCREEEPDFEKLLYVLADSYQAMSEAVPVELGGKPSNLVAYWEDIFQQYNKDHPDLAKSTKYTSAYRGGKLVMYGVASVVNDRWHKTAGFYREYNNNKNWVFSRQFWLEYIEYAKSHACNRISADIIVKGLDGQRLGHWETMLLVGKRMRLPYTAEINDDNRGLWTLYFNENVHKTFNPHLLD